MKIRLHREYSLILIYTFYWLWFIHGKQCHHDSLLGWNNFYIWFNSFYMFRTEGGWTKKQWYFNPFPNKPWFLRVCSTSLLKTLWEKEKLLVTSNFSFSHSVFYPFRRTHFYPFRRTFCHFHHLWNCRLQTLWIWKGLKFVVCERVNCSSSKMLSKFLL